MSDTKDKIKTMPPVGIITLGTFGKSWLPMAYKLREDCVPLVRSKPGLGKTSAGIQFANRMDRALAAEAGEETEGRVESVKATVALKGRHFGYIDTRVPMAQPTDVKGFPYASRELGVSGWLPPDNFPTESNIKAGRVPEHGLWVLEEFPLGVPLVRSAFAQPLLERHINGDPIGSGWLIMATGNRLQDKSGVSKLEAFNVSRMWHCEIRVDIEEWSTWAQAAGLDPITIAFFRTRPEMLDTFDPATWVQDTPYSCPRTAEKLARLVTAWKEEHGMHSKPSLDMVVGYVGRAVAHDFWNYMDVVGDIPTIEEIVKDPGRAKVPPRTNPGALYAISTMLGSFVDAERITPFVTYLTRLPKEFEVVGVRDMMTKAPDLITGKAMTDWCSKNAGIFTDLR